MTETTAAELFWDDFYRDGPVWSGRPNALLVREVTGLPPGTALDLGCAEGADAVWLARRGWRVTGVDVSATALRRAAAHAAEAGVAVTWERHDLTRTFPAGTFDLVCAQYLHSPAEVAGERDAVLRRAAEAVAPGGLLLVVGHDALPVWQHDDGHGHGQDPGQDHDHDGDGHHAHLPSTAEVRAALDLDPARWRVELEDVVERTATVRDGRSGTFRDNVLRIRRTP